MVAHRHVLIQSPGFLPSSVVVLLAVCYVWKLARFALAVSVSF